MTVEIIVDDEYNFGEPTLPSGFTVIQVMQLLEDGSVDEAADRLEIPAEEVEAARDYYKDNADEMDQLWREKRETAEQYRWSG